MNLLGLFVPRRHTSAKSQQKSNQKRIVLFNARERHLSNTLMGRKSRLRVNHLPEKLLQIRIVLGLSQSGMVERIGLEEITDRSVISAYERGEREPPLPVLLRYARSVGVVVDYLIDDDLNLQEQIKELVK